MKVHGAQDNKTVTLLVQGTTATIRDYRWTSESKPLAMLLNAKLLTSGPYGSDPHPSLTAAKRAAADLGGQLVIASPAAFDPELVY